MSRVQLENIALAVLVVLGLFWNLGGDSIYEWDEARLAVNAAEMLQTGDLINYYYNGELDTWSAKPALMVWLVSISYSLFGLNEWSLRLPNALVMLLFFCYVWRFANEFVSRRVAIITVLILLSCNAILVRHVGRSADFDGLFITMSLAMYFHLFRSRMLKVKKEALLAGVFLGLAFWAKGFAVVTVLPGVALFWLLSGEALKVLKRRNLWYALGIGLVISSSWLVLQVMSGQRAETAPLHGGDSTISTMIVHDMLERFQGYDGDIERSWGFVFGALDAHFNLWFYTIGLFGVLCAYVLYRRKSLGSFFRGSSVELFAVCTCLCLFGIVTISQTQFYWYLAPVFALFALLGARCFDFWYKRMKWLAILFGLLFIGQASIQGLKISSSKSGLRAMMSDHQIEIQNAPGLVMLETQRQDVMAYLRWFGSEKVEVTDKLRDDLPAGTLVFTRTGISHEESDLEPVDNSRPIGIFRVP